MATRIIHRRGNGVPAASEFASVGEILIDTSTGTAYNLTDGGEVVALGGGGSSGGTGAGLVISPTEPADPVDGMQWLDSTTARVWVWDEDKWLEFPANVPAGEEYDDTELRGLISDEESARQLADEALQDQIDNLSHPAPVIVSEDEPDGSIGQLWYRPSEGAMYVHDGNGWEAFGSGGEGPGPEPEALIMSVQMIAGGGGSSTTAANSYVTGGGGGGGFREEIDIDVEKDVEYTITVGGGGAVGGSGGHSGLKGPGFDWTVSGGNFSGASGLEGSGGGGRASGSKGYAGGAGGTYGQNGGTGHAGASGGGGGAGETPATGTTQNVAVDGGYGLACYDGEGRSGGGGGAGSVSSGRGNYGGGIGSSVGGYAGAGVDGFGGGAGGACPSGSQGAYGAVGGSGAVLIKTPQSNVEATGDYTMKRINEEWIYVFTSSGTVTFK